MKKFVLGILAFIWLGFWTIFAQNSNILPDSAEIEVKSEIVMNEATNLKVTIMKSDSPMKTYKWTIRILVTDLNWNKLKDNEYTVPSQWMYTFQWSDLWTKEFQRWLEIKKEWKFYVEIQDINDNEEKALWRQLVTVIKEGKNKDKKHIELYSPITNANLIWEKVEVIGICADIPNSEATIYIDEKEVWKCNIWADWSFDHTVPNVTAWQHTLSVEIPNADWDIIWESDKIFFTISPSWEWWIKEVLVEPEFWLVAWDMPEVTVYTDEVIETVEMRLSDRPDDEAESLQKIWIWEFSKRFFLYTWWEINLSFDTSAANNSVHKSYDNYKTIKVSHIPIVTWLVASTHAKEKTADIYWDVINGSIVTWYVVKWWIDDSTLSWEDWAEKKTFKFNDVPYDTTINVNITPVRWQDRHWSASKTIKFTISKIDNCGNWICDEWETPETCPQDCSTCGNWICESWETPETCPQDCWPMCGNWICEPWETPENCPEDCWKINPISTCTIQTVPVRTTKIWDSYYLIRDKAKDVTKYLVYSSPTPDPKNRIKVYETTDTSYEYPFDYNAKEETYMYFWVIWICEWEEYDLTWATKVKVWPAENFFLLLCLTLLIYAWIKLFRQTEE